MFGQNVATKIDLLAARWHKQYKEACTSTIIYNLIRLEQTTNYKGRL